MKILVKYDKDYQEYSLKWDSWLKDFVRMDGKLLWVNTTYGW